MYIHSIYIFISLLFSFSISLQLAHDVAKALRARNIEDFFFIP